jgi:protocatechuate 3,4-dioxygenase beta subunit
MRLIAFACLLPMALSAQPQVSPDDLCPIEGRVVNALTGEPLKKATLSLRNLDPVSPGTFRPLYSTVSAPDGRFAMKDIEPGSYLLSAERTGFLRASYGTRSPDQRSVTLHLSRGQTLRSLDFRLTPHAVISGRVVDEDGDPAVNAQIQLLRLSYSKGRKQLEPLFRGSNIRTNDLGEYRIFGLVPGRYVLAANYLTTAGAQRSLDRSATPRNNEDYLPTYYPGTADADAAILFEVVPGAELRGIDVQLVKAHTVNVRGRVTNAVLPGRQAVDVYLVAGNSNRGAFSRPAFQADASGRFEIRSVPGSYVLQASISEGDKFYLTRQPIEVRDQDIDNLILTISLGVALPGRVRVEGNSTADLASVSFNLISPDTNVGGYTPLKKEDRTFGFDNLNTGHYDLRGNLPAGYYVKAARLGDSDILASGLDVAGEFSAPLEVVLSPHAGQIAGAVQNPDTQRPAPFSVVVLVPQEKERRDRAWYYKTVTADGSGSLTLTSIAPGEYKLYAWDEIEDGAYMDSEFMEPFASKGEHVSVREGGQLTEQLTLISTEAPASPNAR